MIIATYKDISLKNCEELNVFMYEKVDENFLLFEIRYA